VTFTLGSNINSLFALLQLGSQTRELSTTYQRLSSGLRIKSASDDPAGLSLSSKISTDARVVGDIYFPPRNWEHRLQRER